MSLPRKASAAENRDVKGGIKATSAGQEESNFFIKAWINSKDSGMVLFIFQFPAMSIFFIYYFIFLSLNTLFY